jgi:hypothetical protein
MNNTQDLMNIIDGLTSLANHFADGSPYDSNYVEETLLKDAAFTIEQQLPIPVRERLPDEQGDYWCWCRRKTDEYGWHKGFYIPFTGWECAVSGYTLREVTHWLPIPPKPE